MSVDAESSTQRIRLLNICETAQGGVGTYQNILQGLDDAGFTIHVVAPAQHVAIFEPEVSVSTFENPKRGPQTIWRLIRKYLQARSQFRPDICFFHSAFSLAALAWTRLSFRSGVTVYCAHGWAVRNYVHDSFKGRLVRLIEGNMCGLADVVINVSEAERDLAVEYGYRGLHVVINNAVPPAAHDANGDLFANTPTNTNLLFVGRLDRQKGVDLLLPAFAAAREKHPDLTLHIVGSEVRDATNMDALPEGVILAGWVAPDKIDDWYKSADALVVPSRWEGLPLVILEAYRNGTPVLCSNASGMDSLVVSGVTGDSFDLSVEDLTEALLRYTKSDLRAMRPASKRHYLDKYQAARLRDEMAVLLRGLVT